MGWFLDLPKRAKCYCGHSKEQHEQKGVEGKHPCKGWYFPDPATGDKGEKCDCPDFVLRPRSYYKSNPKKKWNRKLSLGATMPRNRFMSVNFVTRTEKSWINSSIKAIRWVLWLADTIRKKKTCHPSGESSKILLYALFRLFLVAVHFGTPADGAVSDCRKSSLTFYWKLLGYSRCRKLLLQLGLFPATGA